jgi:hypothetical protein
MSAGALTKLIFCVVRRLVLRRGVVMNDITQGEVGDVGLSECLCISKTRQTRRISRPKEFL